MRHSSKKLLIPEDQYIQLTKLISGHDSMQVEKAITNGQIEKILNSRLSNLVKNIKYNLLSKKRKKLNKILLKKPTDVSEIVDTTVQALMKELGHDKAERPLPTTGFIPNYTKNSLKDIQNHLNEPELVLKEKESENLEKSTVSEENAGNKVTKRQENLEKKLSQIENLKGSIDKKYYNNLKEYVFRDENLKKFGINKEGEIFSNKKNMETDSPMLQSSVDNVLKILVGEIDPSGNDIELNYTKALLKRLTNDEVIKQMHLGNFVQGEFSGQGKILKNPKKRINKNIYVLDARKNYLKTKGLERRKPNSLKAQLWTKIGV